MISNKEKIFENHIKQYLVDKNKHGYRELTAADCNDKEHHLVFPHLIEFIKETQLSKYNKLIENYGTDADDEIRKALVEDLKRRPLWVIIRNGLLVRGEELKLYFPKPRSSFGTAVAELYKKNIFGVKSQYYFVDGEDKSIDLVLFLNGLPIITIELKHEDEGQNVHDAVAQYNLRPQNNKIFIYPFLHIASDTSEVKVATNPFADINFQWFNEGMINRAGDKAEYPVEYLYKKALSKDQVLEYISFYLIYVPAENKVDETGIRILKDASVIFPRYHQLRSTQRLATDLVQHFNEVRCLGNKYLINHSAGSGKTLTISWMADRLDSLYAANNTKLFDLVFVLTDRRSLDKNVKDDLAKLVHLKEKIGLTKHSDELRRFIKQRKSIVVTTIQKFAYIQELLEEDETLKQLKIAFIIDEAHRGQDGKMAKNSRALFTNAAEPDKDNEKGEEEEFLDEIRELKLNNQVLIAFTATPIQSTVDFFGQPFDEYTEDEAIREGYIKDVATNIISYQTLYHLKSKTLIPDDELYPAGIVHKALRDVAYRDPELIEYKSEVILRYFEDKVKNELNGEAKAMVVASSRPAGLLFFQALKEKLEKRRCPYKVLFAFSDYTDEHGNEIKEELVNELNTLHDGKLIQEVFDEKPEYRIMVVANKFQVGFNQPKLVAMFLDKVVSGVNAVQTLSRLNRNYPGKDTPMVLDFTNSVDRIFAAFRQYRRGSNFTPQEPSPDTLEERYKEFLSWKLFSEAEVSFYTKLVKEAANDHTKDGELMTLANEYRKKFIEIVPDKTQQKEVVLFLQRFVSEFYFISLFYQLPEYIVRFAFFAEAIADKLFKKGSMKSLSDYLKHLMVEKSAVRYRGIVDGTSIVNEPPRQGGNTGGNGPSGGNGGFQPPRASVPEVMDDLRNVFQISDEEAILINAVIEELVKDEFLVTTIQRNASNPLFMKNYRGVIRQRVIKYYFDHNWDDRLIEGPYINPGGIIDYIVKAIVQLCASQAA